MCTNVSSRRENRQIMISFMLLNKTPRKELEKLKLACHRLQVAIHFSPGLLWPFTLVICFLGTLYYFYVKVSIGTNMFLAHFFSACYLKQLTQSLNVIKSGNAETSGKGMNIRC